MGIGDIPPGSYQLVYANLTSFSVLFYWQLTGLLPELLESGFITGSQYNLMFLNGTVVNSHINDNINFALNGLNPGQWYLICVSLVTTDNSSWPPGSSCLNFETKQGTGYQSQNSKLSNGLRTQSCLKILYLYVMNNSYCMFVVELQAICQSG